MADDFLGRFMCSAARAKALRVFIFSQGRPLTLAQASSRAGISRKSAAREIQALERFGILKKSAFAITLGNGTKRVVGGRQKEPAWAADPNFAYASALSKFVHEVSPVRYAHVVLGLKRLGKMAVIILSGSFMGDESRPADLVVAGDQLNERRLEAAVRALEREFGREIRYAAFSTPEFRYRLTIQDRLLRETLDFPHIILLDKEKML